MTAATSIIVEQSPFFVRVGRTMPQMTFPIADWAAKNNIKTVVTLVSDYAPGIDAEKFFKERFEAAGGKVLDSLRASLIAPTLGLPGLAVPVGAHGALRPRRRVAPAGAAAAAAVADADSRHAG